MKWLFLGLFAAAAGSGLAESPKNPLAHALNDSFADVYQKVAPAVVVLEVRYPGGVALQGLPQGFEFTPQSPETDEGCGFIISADGYIVTNNHVVASAPKGSITVTLKDGRKFKAEVVGADDKSDVAVIKIPATHLPTVDLADSDAVRVGQFAFAIGAPYELPYTFTEGIVSAMGRAGNSAYQEYIQTDAAINPGNSGGPLCDIDGRVVGMNTMISGNGQGLGFALPINTVKETAQQLIDHGYVSRPWLGIRIVGLDEYPHARQYFPDVTAGVIIFGIEPATPASSSNLRAGDVILKVDGVSVASAQDLQKQILTKKIGQVVHLAISRDGHDLAVSLSTGEQPSSMIRAAHRQIDSSASSGDPSSSAPSTQPAPSSGPQGMLLQDAPADQGPAGAVVTDVDDNSVAAGAGLLPGDIVTEAAGKPVRSAQDLTATLSQADLSRGVMLMVDRRGQQTFVILKR